MTNLHLNGSTLSIRAKNDSYEKILNLLSAGKEHIQMAINKYMTIKQGERLVSEYIVEREKLEVILEEGDNSKNKGN